MSAAQPTIKDALEAQAIVDEYNKAHPAPVIIDFMETTDLSNAKRFVQLHRRNVVYIPIWKCWGVWNRARWAQNDDRQMVPYVEEMIINMRRGAESLTSTDQREKLLKHATSTQSENRIMACIRLAASQPEILASPDDFDKNKYLLNFPNGTLDLRTGEFREHRREDKITRVCAVEYKPEANCPLWLGFLDKIFPDDREIIDYLQILMGMAFTGDVSEEVFHIFYGTGSNGKTTFLKTMNNILGYEYFKTISVETLLKRGQKAIANDIARMQGARIVWANEPEFDDVLTEGKVKKLVSNERILGEMKFKEPVEFDPEFTVILSCNHKPGIRGVDEGMRRRVRLIEFNTKITDADKDIHFAEKLVPELPAILNWVLEGCFKWQQKGLIPPEKVLESTSEYHEEMDRLADLFNLYFINEPQAKTPHILLYTVYKLWAQENELFVMSEKAFTQVMLERGYRKIISRYPDGRQFKGFASVTCNKLIIPSVTDFLMAPADEKSIKKEALLLMLRQITNPFHIIDTRARDIPETSVTSVTNDMQSHNDIFSQSVTSVTLVTRIKDKLKEKYDQFNKPNSIQDLERLKKVVEEYIYLEIIQDLPDDQEPDRIAIRSVVEDYCKVRGWQQ